MPPTNTTTRSRHTLNPGNFSRTFEFVIFHWLRFRQGPSSIAYWRLIARAAHISVPTLHRFLRMGERPWEPRFGLILFLTAYPGFTPLASLFRPSGLRHHAS